MAGTQQPAPLIAGRYRLGSRLGRGGMAEVFDAFDERLERPVALKVLRKEVAAEPQMRQRFEAEARAAARLSHPAVVSVYDSGEHGGRAFLIMERLPGETLADRIKRGPVDQPWLKQAAADVLSALAAAHAIGLIHRDIKPGNILITEDNRVKVADFGIAKSVVGTNGGEDLTQVGMVLGTPAYLAPERLGGQAATVGTDLYALGVVLYEAATGHKPPAGAADATVVGTGAAGAGALAPAAGDPPLDPALARVIRRSMAPDPAERYASADAMAADLARGGSGAAVPATVALPQTAMMPAPTQVLAEPRPREIAEEERVAAADPVRRRGLAIAAGLIALLILVVILVLLLTRHSSPPAPATTTVAPTTSTTQATTSTTQATTTTTQATTTTTAPTTTTTRPTTTTTAPTTTTTTTTPTVPGVSVTRPTGLGATAPAGVPAGTSSTSVTAGTASASAAAP